MEFNIPTTLEDMYTVLNDLFYYYRVRKQGYEEVNLEELSLPRLSDNLPSDEELLITATLLLEPKHTKEKLEYEEKLSLEIQKIEQKIQNCGVNAQNQIDNVTSLYEESMQKIKQQLSQAGLMYTSIYSDKIAQNEEGKIEKINAIVQARDNEISELSSEKAILQSKLNSMQSMFTQIHQKEINAKKNELIKERESLSRDIFKYNNSLEEKEQRYRNTIKETQSSLMLRFLDISSGEFTHDQLVEMGYYEDVLLCVSGYFDTLPAEQAYYDILAEKKLVTFLDDYYQQIIYVYKLRAGI